MAVCPGVLEQWSQSAQPRGVRAALAARSARGFRSPWMHAALAAAGKTSPSSSSRGCAGPGGLALMSRAAHRPRRLEACSRLHTHGALARARWSRVVARRHPSATKAAT
jgi:hypothetical protein